VKKLLGLLIIAGLLGVTTGCPSTPSTKAPDKSGKTEEQIKKEKAAAEAAAAAKKAEEAAAAAKDSAFMLKGPAGTTTVKQGATADVKITIEPGKKFKEGIKFKTSVDKEGLTAKVDPASWKAGDPTDVKVTVGATDKTEPGDYEVTVTGTPDKGDAASVTFKVAVAKK
jgi:uncharacterized membrane protein